jgi:hypothetical protein
MDQNSKQVGLIPDNPGDQRPPVCQVSDMQVFKGFDPAFSQVTFDLDFEILG